MGAEAGRLFSEAERWIADSWLGRLTDVASAMIGDTPAGHWEAAADHGDAGAFWWEQNYSGALEGRAWVGANADSWTEIGRLALAAAGIEDAEPADYRGTYQEIIAQSLGGLAQAITSRLGREVSLSASHEGAPPAGYPAAAITLVFGTGNPIPLLFVFAPALIEPFLPAPTAAAAQPAADRGGGVSPLVGTSKTLDLLLEVELPVSVSFGRATLALKDLLKLTSGSIVDLNRSVSEPVEVIVNNCVIARGEVVVIEGNYGVRINQIISKQERLRTLS